MPKVKVNDINMYYESHGQGKTVTMIPGIGGDTSQFKRIIQTLSPQYQVVALDNRGAGQSDKPEEKSTMAIFTKDVADLLKSLEDISGPVHIVGLSLGGAVAFEFALKYPKLTKTMTAAATFSILDTYVPSMAVSARSGAGFGMGANLVGFPRM